MDLIFADIVGHVFVGIPLQLDFLQANIHACDRNDDVVLGKRCHVAGNGAFAVKATVDSGNAIIVQGIPLVVWTEPMGAYDSVDGRPGAACAGGVVDNTADGIRGSLCPT